MDLIISPTQTGFLPGRFIGENTRLIYDLLHFTERENIPGLLVLIDFKKAFDMVSWSFLSKVLELYNFGPNLCKWVNIFNRKIIASICQYGNLSDKIEIQRGCRQGDPLSVYLFVICAQILYIMIELNKDIKGITVNEKEIQITQFADDTTLILNGERSPLQEALNTLEIFGSYSGLVVNTDKTQVVWIGKKRCSKDKLNVDKTLHWGSTSFNLLGIKFSTDLMSVPSLNYRAIFEDLPKILNVWKKRYTTPFGRITILKTFILPKLIHLFTVLPKPHMTDIKQINSIFYKFVWHDKPEKIKRNIINKSYKEGGLKMIDLESFIDALQLSWVKRYFLDTGSQWSILTDYNIGRWSKFMEMGSLWHLKLKEKVTNVFYLDILTNWHKFWQLMSYRDPLSMPLWYNPHISKYELFIKNLYSNGCIHVSDVCKGNAVILTPGELSGLYHYCPNFLEYQRLKSGVTKFLKDSQVTGPIIKPIQPTVIRLLNTKTKGSRMFYNTLLGETNLVI